MAVTEVTATIVEETKQMHPLGNDKYEANLKAPIESGDYPVEITARDDAGNVSVANAESDKGMLVNVTKWHKPKTNWTVNDRFNFVDYNRIKNNLEYLHEEAVTLWRQFEIENMGEDILDYESYWQASFFNTWERNLEIINSNILIRDYGEKEVFYDNGVFIQWDELNRIEGATLSMKGILDRQKAALRKLSFRLGAFKGVKV